MVRFLVWASLSVFYALNRVEVIVNLSRQFSVFFMIANMAILSYKIKNINNLFSIIITVILTIESIVLINDAFEMINSSGIINSGQLKGVTANRNITAFSIALKIPFVLYLLRYIKSFKLKLLLNCVILTLGILDILIIQSRASYLALVLISDIHFSYLIFNRENKIIHSLKRIVSSYPFVFFSFSESNLFC